MRDQFNINRCDDCGDQCDSDFCYSCEKTAEYVYPPNLIAQSKRDEKEAA